MNQMNGAKKVRISPHSPHALAQPKCHRFCHSVRARGSCTSLSGSHPLTSARAWTELIDKCIGSKMWVLMKGDKELVGTLKGARLSRCRSLPRWRGTCPQADSFTSPQLHYPLDARTSMALTSTQTLDSPNPNPDPNQASTTTSTWCSRT